MNNDENFSTKKRDHIYLVISLSKIDLRQVELL